MSADTGLTLMKLYPGIFITAIPLWMLILGYIQPDNPAHWFLMIFPVALAIALCLIIYTFYLIEKECKDKCDKIHKTRNVNIK